MRNACKMMVGKPEGKRRLGDIGVDVDMRTDGSWRGMV
jgi:hypothetical protein